MRRVLLVATVLSALTASAASAHEPTIYIRSETQPALVLSVTATRTNGEIIFVPIVPGHNTGGSHHTNTWIALPARGFDWPMFTKITVSVASKDLVSEQKSVDLGVPQANRVIVLVVERGDKNKLVIRRVP
jgi:hypothetical protein